MLDETIFIGVLGLQGDFMNHFEFFRTHFKDELKLIIVKKKEDLQEIDGLVIPGGESTSISIIAKYSDLLEPLRDFVSQNKPVWGVCAGLVFLSKKATHTMKGGQEFLGGIDIVTNRNYFGSQKDSFQIPLTMDCIGADIPFDCIFIRAPAILEVGEGVDVLGTFDCDLNKKKLIVAAKQNNILVTAFHPELSTDPRWHSFFIQIVKNNKLKQ